MINNATKIKVVPVQESSNNFNLIELDTLEVIVNNHFFNGLPSDSELNSF